MSDLLDSLKRSVVGPSDHVPVNYQTRNLKNLETDINYALNCASVFARLVDQCELSMAGLRALELGPGSDFGAHLILASMGAKIILADRYLAPWDEGYHPTFYRQLAARWDGPKHVLEAAIDEGGYADLLVLLEEPAEDLASIPDESIDFVYSNAVLEHIYDLPRVARETARVLRVGGRAAHQIDMRDHRDFSRPIEYLIMPDSQFNAAAATVHFEFGNRHRSAEFWAHFENAGLRVTARDINSEAELGYRDSALQRLRSSPSSYRCWPAADVFRVGGRFFLLKEAPQNAAILKERAKDMLDVIEALKGEASKAEESKIKTRSWFAALRRSPH
jgi:SAM-dependent methyltransferase